MRLMRLIFASGGSLTEPLRSYNSYFSYGKEAAGR